MDVSIQRFIEETADILGDSLVGIYLHGSAAMGCYNPMISDIDLMIIVNDIIPDDVKRRYMDIVIAADGDVPAKGIEMSIVQRRYCDPFVYPTPFELHYSRMHTKWYTDDPDDYISKMKGTDKDLAAHFTIIRSRGICLQGLPIDEVFGEVPGEYYYDSICEDIAEAAEDIKDNTMYITLNLARVLAYRREKLILSKKEGGEWALSHIPDKYAPLISAALDKYNGTADMHYDAALAQDYAGYMLEMIGIHK